MKRYIPALCLAVVTVLILLTAASQPYYPITRPYKCPYPVGSDEWIAVRESSSSPPIDEATISGMSTKALVLSYIDYPYESRYGYATRPPHAFGFMMENSPVLTEIMHRDDLVKALCDICSDVKTPDFDYYSLSEDELREMEYKTDRLYKLEFICSQIDLERPVKKEAVELKNIIEKMTAKIEDTDPPFHSYYSFLKCGRFVSDFIYIP